MMPNRETQGHLSLSFLLLSLLPASAGISYWNPTRNQNSRVQWMQSSQGTLSASRMDGDTLVDRIEYAWQAALS